MKAFLSMLPLVAMTSVQLFASVSVEISAPTSTISVGETLTLRATARDSAGPSRFSYQFAVRPHNLGRYVTMRDYYWTNTFAWTPSDHEGDYDIGVTAWSSRTHNSAPDHTTVHVSSRVTGKTPVISPTNNALVALYSAPACSAPAQMQVEFQTGSSSNPPVRTPLKTCNGLSMNFYVGGMLANTTYTMQQMLVSNGSVTSGPTLSYTTGSIPDSVKIPAHMRLIGPDPTTSGTYPYLLHASDGFAPYATDLNEKVMWYLTASEQGDSGYLTHLVSGGTLLGIQDDPVNSAAVCPPGTVGRGCGDHQHFREYDLAGNVIRETSWVLLNDKINELRARQHRPTTVKLNFISHEGIRLPDGYTVTMVTDEQVRDQGDGRGKVDVLGDAVVVLDTHWQVAWAWDAFDFVNIQRKAVIEPAVCTPGGPGCPPQFHNLQPNGKPYTQANDWTHGNSIFYDPSDGNFIVSLRNQSQVLKIAYQNGAGDGHILWTFGFGGSFALASGYTAGDWPSGQHDVEIQANGLMTLFDNNNPSPVTDQPGGTAHGQAWKLDTTNMIATPEVNIDLGVVSPAVGSATLLSNGDYEWQAGFVGGNSAQTFEFTPSGTLVYKEQSDALTYRSFRLHDLYTP